MRFTADFRTLGNMLSTLVNIKTFKANVAIKKS